MGTKPALEARPRPAAQKSELHHYWKFAEVETIHSVPLAELVFRADTIYRATRAAGRLQSGRMISNMVPRG